MCQTGNFICVFILGLDVMEMTIYLKNHYKSHDWTRTVMLPWMEKDKYPSIDDFYVHPTINITSTRVNQTNATRYFDSCDDFFNGSKPQRLLLQGPPGFGKTVFVHKLAHEWASGNCTHFDLVFVLKLRDMNLNDTIETAILDQFSLSDFTVKSITDILKSNKPKTLVILDALDEIIIANHNDIRRVVHGKLQHNFWLLLTSRPHEIGEAIAMKYDTILHIKGFPGCCAMRFLGIITKHNVGLARRIIKKEYLSKIETRDTSAQNKSGYFSPFLIHCVALIAADPNQEFPDTPTGFYMALIKAILIKQSKNMPDADRDKALRYSARLAYEGLINYKPIEIRSIEDDSIFKLGFLSGYDIWKIFKTKVHMKIYFIHPSIQYFLAAFHILDQMSLNENALPLEKYLQHDGHSLSQFIIGNQTIVHYSILNILSRASEAGSPTNCPGSDKIRARDPWFVHRWTRPTVIMAKYLYTKNFKNKRTAHLIRLFY